MKKPSYAATTTVSIERSRTELDTMLGKYGATTRGIMTGRQAEAIVLFQLGEHSYRLSVPMPDAQQYLSKVDPTAKDRKRWEQACRTRWRVVVLHVRSKLEAIAMGVSTPEREFMADLVVGRYTLGEMLASQPKLLPALASQSTS